MRDNPKYVLYNANNVPFEVWSLSAFCQEQRLNVQAMKDVVRGKSKQHQGWHLDEARTQQDNVKIAEFEAMLDGTWTPSPGNQFGKPWQPQPTK